MPATRCSAAFIAVMVSMTPVSLEAQADGPAARRARELVALINTAAPPAIRAYVDSAFGGRMKGMPMAAHLNFLLGQREQSGGLDWVSAEAGQPTSVTAVLKRKLTSESMGLAVTVEQQAPHRIIGIGGRPVEGRDPKTPVASDADLAAQVEKYVATLADADVFSGAVLVAKDGKVLFSRAYGIANRDFGAPNKLDTKFNLGSMNKMFTAVAVAQLVEQGKLSFDDPLAKFVPGFPTAAAAEKIRVKHLLTHTAGLGSYFNEEFMRSSRARYRTVDEMMQLAKGDSMAFEPGSRWSYSNTGMLVLGKVIEVASGEDYFSYVREHIAKPAGMINTDAYELDYVNPNLAVGYDKEYRDDGSKRYRNNIFQHVIRGGPAGGGYSTVEDLLRFAEALKAGKLVGKQYVALLTTPKPELSSPRYGYGFGAEPQSEIVGHSGGFPGISSNLDIFTKSGYVAAVQANYGGASQPVVQKIRSLVQARLGAPTS
jgi:CubicO group peptidase (beta-lactamase class C family)